jgi:TatD DNase family protein
MMLIDTHIHLDSKEFQPDLPDIIARAKEKKTGIMLVPNVDSSTSESVINICAAYSDSCFPMMGLHPTSVKEDFKNELERIEKTLFNYQFVAVGEIGIDLYWDKTFYKEQEIVFIHQMEIARKLKIPAVIHSRKSLDEISGIIKRNNLGDVRAVFHCFPGSVEQARHLTDAGYFLGIGGVVTFKNAHMVEVVRQIPLEYLVLETDGPYLAPVPFRGKRNEPSYIPIIAQKVAEIKNITLEEVAEITTGNAKRLFSGIR